MKVIMAGASGFIGQALKNFLENKGHAVYCLVRKSTKKDNEIYWDPSHQKLDALALEGCHVIINLAGENIFGKWTAQKKQEIFYSRVATTRLLAQTVSSLAQPPAVYINASATGYLGAISDEKEAPQGSSFLANCCQAWEDAAKIAEKKTRVVLLRFGTVLSKDGGALAKMLPIFKLGLGGKLGNGKQYMSWISTEDLLEAIYFLIEHQNCRGAFNLVSPEPVRNEEFTKMLGKALHRPTFMHIPAFAARLAFGQLADEILLCGSKIYPDKLLQAGYTFKHPILHGALSDILNGRNAS